MVVTPRRRTLHYLSRSRLFFENVIVLTLTLQTSDRNNEVAIWDSNIDLVKVDFESFQQTLGTPLDQKLNHGPVSAPSSGGPAVGGNSSLLIPMVQFCLGQIDATMADVRRIAVTLGPGMFTPLRVGVVAAKTMAYVNQIPVVGINVLEAVALNAAGRHQLPAGHRIVSVVNAQRKQLFVGEFTVTPGHRVTASTPSRLVPAQRWAESLAGEVLISGPGLKILGDATLKSLSETFEVVVESPDYWRCQSSTLADIAGCRFANDDADDAWSLSPIYFRPSAAEEVRLRQPQ